ncbi:sensor histidine kinase [Cellulosilyticum sp. I15G10I2]|uniref:sensor histidine kinase n=1 Tax=Cellulosilyticum sp. I15G10I2 TaxID=1892843 RepID=UPI00085CD525|nr:sensor histidine kinase [Cellulosilyticum sp. I15G10I2]
MFTYNVLINRIKQKFMDASIKTKIILIFTAFMIGYVIITSILYVQVLDTQRTKQLHQSAYQSIDLMKSNIDSNIETINNVSKLIISDSNVRKYLTSYDNSLAYRRPVYQTLTQLYVTFPFIDSIFVYRFSGANVNASRSVTFSLVDNIRFAPWYEEVLALEGKYLININAGGTLIPNTGKNNISMIRILYDVEKLVPIGLLVINISQDFFSPIIEETKLKYGTSFVLLDANDEPIIKDKDSTPINLPRTINSYFSGIVEKIDGAKFFILSSEIPKYNWKIISYTPLDTMNGTINTLSFILVILLVCTITIFLSASFFAANFAISPINKLIAAMEGVKQGRFKRVNILTGNDELGELKNTYNLMVKEIEKMIIREVDTEKQKRKFELDILNEQIKPHFLYNTLDSIAYLALSRNNKDVYSAINALGQFYKFSLNKGNELITLEAEVTMIKNYLTLQKLRYGTLFNDSYALAEDTLKIPILKNSLQPLVENCIYHGIKPSGEPGNILITSNLIKNTLYITVEDDGLGMSPEEIQHIQSEYLEENLMSFGLRGTIARLKIHYGTNDIYEVTSERFKGSTVTLKIPVKEEIE